MPVPGLYWADAASIGPVLARYWPIPTCLQGKPRLHDNARSVQISKYPNPNKMAYLRWAQIRILLGTTSNWCLADATSIPRRPSSFAIRVVTCRRVCPFSWQRNFLMRDVTLVHISRSSLVPEMSSGSSLHLVIWCMDQRTCSDSKSNLPEMVQHGFSAEQILETMTLAKSQLKKLLNHAVKMPESCSMSNIQNVECSIENSGPSIQTDLYVRPSEIQPSWLI